MSLSLSTSSSKIGLSRSVPKDLGSGLLSRMFFIYYLYLIVLFLNAKTDPMIQLSWVQEAEHNTEAVRGNVPHTLALLLGKFPIQKDL